jgi:hypothetical protein
MRNPTVFDFCEVAAPFKKHNFIKRCWRLDDMVFDARGEINRLTNVLDHAKLQQKMMPRTL